MSFRTRSSLFRHRHRRDPAPVKAISRLIGLTLDACQFLGSLAPVVAIVVALAIAPQALETARRGSAAAPRSGATATLQVGQTPIHCLAWAPDGSALSAAGQDGQVARRGLDAGRVEAIAAGSIDDLMPEELYRIAPLALTRDGTTVAAGPGPEVILRAAADGHTWASFRVDAPLVKSLAFSPDGVLLAAGCVDGSVVLWETTARRARATLCGHTAIVNGLAFSRDGRSLATAGHDGTLCVWDVATGRLCSSVRGASAIRSVAFSPDGRTIATCGIYLLLWDAAAGCTKRTVLDRVGGYYSGLDYSPDGRWLAATSPARRTITFWDLASPGRQATVRGRVGPGFALAFAPDGRTLASGGEDGIIELWTVADVFGQTQTPAK
jgi:WD40 repeat protein